MTYTEIDSEFTSDEEIDLDLEFASGDDLGVTPDSVVGLTDRKGQFSILLVNTPNFGCTQIKVTPSFKIVGNVSMLNVFLSLEAFFDLDQGVITMLPVTPRSAAETLFY